MTKQTRFLILLIPIYFFSCKSYKQDILFNVDEEAVIQQAVYDVEKNYRIQSNDFLQIRVYTNEGERAIDPNGELQQAQNNSQNSTGQNQLQYMVQQNGEVKFPMIGLVNVEGLTLNEAEKELEKLYDEFFKGSFVKLVYLNKRVTVLGHVSAVVPLENDNTSLLEVLSLAGGVKFGSRAHNIRILRGDLSNPQVFIVDLNTITGMQHSIVDVQPGDIIYLEPWRRPWLEVIRDIAPVISLVTSVITLAFLIATI